MRIANRFAKWSRLAGAIVLAVLAYNPTPATARDFGAPLGLYGGAFATWQFSDFDLNITPASATLPKSVSTNGLGGGFMLGYDWAPFFDNWTVGVIADAAFGDWSQSFGPGNGNQLDVDFLVTMRGRVGYWVSPHLMPYFTAGLAWEGATFKNPPVKPAGAGTATAVTSFANTMPGWTVGTGIDWRLGHTVTLNAEYLYADFSNWTFTTAQQGKFDVPLSSHQLRLGLKIPLSDPEYIDSRRR